jgi:hypothetical protein
MDLLLLLTYDRLEDYNIKLKGDVKSFVWEHFGFLENVETNIVKRDQVYCLPCFGAGKLKAYKESVSTSNLAQHL